MEKLMDWVLEAEEKEGFALNDRAGVSWALRKIAALEGEMEQAQAVADAEMARICEWYKTEKEKGQSRIGFYQTAIEEYMKSHEPDQKSVSLPNGKVQWRSTPTQWTRDDAEILLHVPEEYKKTETKLIWAEYKKRLVVDNSGAVVDKHTGEVVRGIMATPGEQKMYIKTERAGGKNE